MRKSYKFLSQLFADVGEGVRAQICKIINLRELLAPADNILHLLIYLAPLVGKLLGLATSLDRSGF